ncbi:MAG: hypothetical protein GC157_17355 [Frankiales bacterium]|nr:hypothetical protein [Frankiales bacterium]
MGDVFARFGGFTGLFALGFIVMAAVFRDWLVAGTLVVVLGLIAVGQLLARNRARRRMTEGVLSGSTRWRGRVIGLGVAIFDGRTWAVWFNDGVPVDVVAGQAALALEPRGLGRRWGGQHDVKIPWRDVVGARTRDLGRQTPEGKVSFVPLTAVTVLVVGDLVPPRLRLDELMPEEELTDDERAQADEDLAGYLARIRESFGDDYEFGVLPLEFITSDATGLVEAVSARARGTMPSV